MEIIKPDDGIDVQPPRVRENDMTSFKHGGNLKHLAHLSGLSAEEILDFSANINPMGLPEWFGQLSVYTRFSGSLSRSRMRRFG